MLMATAVLRAKESPPRGDTKRRKSPERCTSRSRASPPPRTPNAKPVRFASYIDLIQSSMKPRAKFRELVEGLIVNSGDANATGEHDMTALHYAVLSGDELCVKALVAFGANLNARNEFDQTPLDIAMQNRVEHLIPLLVSIGCKRGVVIKQNSHRFGSPPFTYDCDPCRALLGAACRPSADHRRTATPSRVHEVDEETLAMRRKGLTPLRLGSPPPKGTTLLSEELESHIGKRFELSQSIMGDEAFAVALQQQEITRFRSRNSLDVPPSPLEFRIEGGSRILSLDGGGIRGLVQIEILSEIEKLTGKRITELFDWIIGTSTGGILALGLVYRNMSLVQLRQLYFRLKQQIFANTRLGYAYNSKGLEELLQDELGTDLKMCDIKHPKVMISAVDKRTTMPKLHFFNNCFGDEFSTQPIWKVARYTSAAPMYFTECDNYVDGGVLANNPSDTGMTRIQKFYRDHGIRLPIACVVSIGSGRYPPKQLGNVDAHEAFRSKRQMMRVGDTLKKTQNLVTLLTNALVESEAVAEKCRGCCVEQNIPFYRFSPQLDDKIEAGETDNLKLLDMIIRGKISIHEDMQMERLVPLLLRVVGLDGLKNA